MESWRIIQLLKVLEKQNLLVDFSGWLTYRWEATRVPLRLYQILSELAPWTSVDKHHIWQLLHGKLAYNDMNLRASCSKIVDQVTFFFAIKALEASPTRIDVLALQQIKSLDGAEFLFDPLYKKARKKLTQKTPRSAEGFYQLFQIEILQNQFLLRSHGHTKYKGSNLSAAIQAYDRSWLIHKLSLYASQLSSRQVSGEMQEAPFVHRIMDELPLSDYYMDEPLVFAYFQLCRLLEGQTAQLNEVFKILNRSGIAIDQGDLEELFVHFANGLIRKINTETDKPIQALLDLYQWAFSRKLVFREGYLENSHFNNLVALLIKSEQITAAEEMLDTWGEALRGGVQSETYRLSKGHYFRNRKDHKAMHYYLGSLKKDKNTVRFTNNFYEINRQMVLLEVLTEDFISHNRQEDLDLFLSAVPNIARFIRAQQYLGESHRESFLNRVRLTNKLLKVRSLAELAALVEEIHTTPSLDKRDWLLTQSEKWKARLVQP